MVPICACGHAYANHLARRYGIEESKRAKARGESVCQSCFCPEYEDAVAVDNRNPFRAAQKKPTGNFGSGHPLMLGLAKAREQGQDLSWYVLNCGDCGLEIGPEKALVYDSKFFCVECFLLKPGVFCG